MAMARRCKRPAPAPESIQSIGLLLFGAIGDAILASALCGTLRTRFPNVRLIGMVTLSNRAVADILAGFDEILVMPVTRPFSAARLLRQHRLDVVIDCSQWARIGAFVARLSGARFSIGFRTPGQFRHFGYDGIVLHSSGRHEVQNFLALGAVLGAGEDGRPRVRQLPSENPSALSERFVVFHPWPSGTRSEMREWPIDRWVALARLVRTRGYDIVITGGPADVQASGELARRAGLKESTVLAGKTTLKDAVGVLCGASAVVSVNTGIMHVAAALDRPLVALHGPTNARRWGPLSKRAIAVGPGPECGCGYLNLGYEYPPDPPDCMGKIGVSEVWGALKPILSDLRQVS
jgi:ADP-heptose:LPS heptosyltransferase